MNSLETSHRRHAYSESLSHLPATQTNIACHDIPIVCSVREAAKWSIVLSRLGQMTSVLGAALALSSHHKNDDPQPGVPAAGEHNLARRGPACVRRPARFLQPNAVCRRIAAAGN